MEFNCNSFTHIDKTLGALNILPIYLGINLFMVGILILIFTNLLSLKIEKYNLNKIHHCFFLLKNYKKIILKIEIYIVLLGFLISLKQLYILIFV